MDAETICKRFHSCWSARKNLDNVLQSVEELVVPYRGEFFKDMSSEHEVDWRRRGIFDSTAPVACDMLAGHMFGSLTSPSVKWFGLKYREDDLNDDPAANEWLESSESRLWQAIQESDFNSEAPEVYLDLCSYGTAIFMVEPKVDAVTPEEWEGFDFTALPLMESYFELGGDQKPTRVYRRLRLTALQIQERWPETSADIDFESDDTDTKHDVIFAVYWRDKNQVIDGPMAADQRPVGYKYILKNKKVDLEEGGYYEFPAMVIRWKKTAGSVWGNSPAMLSLSNIRQLNRTVMQVSEARAKVIDPPMKTTETGIVGDLDLQPGGLVVVTDMDELQPLVTNIGFQEAEAEINRLQDAIARGFYQNMLTLKESPAMTATEVNERVQEMLKFMAPTMGRLTNDFLNPMIETMFGAMYRMSQFEEAPDLQDGSLDIEYVGPIPRAQKAEVSMGIQQWLGFVGNFVELMPEMLDLPDSDAVVRTLADLNGVPSKLLKQDDEVEQVRAARAQEQQQMQAMQQMQLAEQAGKAGQEVAAGAEGLQAIEGGLSEQQG